MRIKEIRTDKKQYMELLLLGDEQENMIARYIDRGIIYALYNVDLKGLCLITDEENRVLEIKNIAVYPKFRRQGYGRVLIEHIERKYKKRFDILRVGTGDSPLTVPFYERCGFKRKFIVKDFFIHNYDHPIIECGVQLKDMVYFEKPI